MTRNDRAIAGLTSVSHALVHTYELSIPVLMTAWLAEFGVSSAVLGGVVTAGYALFGLGALPGGVLTDRYGSRRLVMLGLAGMGAAFLALSLAGGLLAVGGALVLWGAAASVYHPAGLALISKGVERRGHVFAYHGIAGNLGTAIGPLTAALLLLVLDWRWVSALLAVPALVAVPLVGRLSIDEAAALDEKGRRAVAEAPPFSWTAFGRGSRRLFASAFALVFAVVLINGLFYRGVLTFMPEVLDGFAALRPVAVAGTAVEPGRYVYVGLLLVGVAGQYAGGRLTDHVRPERGMTLFFGVLALTALAFVPAAHLGLAGVLAACAVLGFCMFGLQPLYQATIAVYTPAGARGLSYGYTYLGVFGIGALGAALAGALLSFAGPATLFIVLAALPATAAALTLLLRRRLKAVGVRDG